MNRSKREDYKRFVVFCLASLIVIAQAAIFAYVWYDFYSDLILKPFWRKGNWVMILIYALIYLMFAKLYGGLKVGYLKRIDVFYSLTLATICTNVVTYFQITLINRWFMSARPVIEMTGVQLVVTVLWIWGSRYIYSRLYGARRLLVIYGEIRNFTNSHVARSFFGSLLFSVQRDAPPMETPPSSLDLIFGKYAVPTSNFPFTS